MNNKEVSQVKFDGKWYKVLDSRRMVLPGIGYEKIYIVSSGKEGESPEKICKSLIEAIMFNDGCVETNYP